MWLKTASSMTFIPPGMGFVDQAGKKMLVPKVRVDFQVVDRVVLVVGAGLEDRAEVQAINSQVLQVVQVVQHPLQVTAVVVFPAWVVA